MRRPDRLRHRLSHRIEAGCDFYLMPSRFEPCGLNQMYSLRYGTVAHRARDRRAGRFRGGHAEDAGGPTGSSFREYSVRALAKAIRKALALYADKPLAAHYRRNGMAADFSWERTALAYSGLYQGLIGGEKSSIQR